MTRPQLTALLEQLRLPHRAQIEHHRYPGRGRHPLPGTRGCVFKQKITEPERVLAAILYQRRACTRQVLADLFEVSPRTIGNILIDIRPLLDQAGYSTHTRRHPLPLRNGSAGGSRRRHANLI